jgi:hypothetical protein
VITVRFPTGTTVVYNSAVEIERLNSGRTQLLKKDSNGSRWIVAEVPADCIVEFVNPCRFENPLHGQTSEVAARLLTQSPEALRSAPPYLLGKLKEMLSPFDRRNHQWREE